MVEPLRVRVVFDDRKMLTRSQRSEGLRKCWLLVKPDVATISGLASHVSKSFKLDRSCPHGVVLSMDDFVVPPFESITVLKQNDIIRVEKKNSTLKNLIENGNNPHYIQDSEAVDKQQIVFSDRRLVTREVEEDTGHGKSKNRQHLWADNKNAMRIESLSKTKKRKHSEEIQGSKRKKKRKPSSSPNDANNEDEGAREEGEGNHLKQSSPSLHKKGSSQKKYSRKDKLSNGDGRPEALITSHLEDDIENQTSSEQREKRSKKSNSVISENAIIATHGAKIVPTEKDKDCYRKGSSSARNPERKHEQPAEGGRSDADAVIPPQPDGSVSRRPCFINRKERNVQCEENVEGNKCQKGPSRNARRKKVKRELLKEIRSQRNQTEKPPYVIHGESQQNETGLSTEMQKETFPVIPKHGSIRFQPLDEEQIRRQQKGRMETLRWNGTASKKGRKWGRDNTAGKWNRANGYNKNTNGMSISGNEKTRRSPAVNAYEQMNHKAISERGKTGTGSLDFQSLFPLTRIPQVGDVIAYRLLELSSSWCPEVSPFRIGQVTSYNYLNMCIILVPLPKYPITSEHVEGRDSALHANSSLYNEDGSLQIHYPSLVDVRLLKASDSEATTSEYSEVETCTQGAPPVNKWEVAVANTNRAKESVIPPTAQPAENGRASDSTWDQMKQVITEKKAELEKRNGSGWGEWIANKSTANTSWSYSGLRNSAGSTLSFLRGRNSKQANRSKYGKFAL